MKIKNIIFAFASGCLLLTSCEDRFMEWGSDRMPIEASEVPLTISEQIARYDVLKNYVSDFKLGVGMGMSLYMTSDPTYSDLVNANFHEVALGYDMKHGAMVDSRGDINFTKVDACLAKVISNGLSVYGHTLVWHSNQNATYLNNLISQAVVYDNLLPNGTFETGVNNWTTRNGNPPEATNIAYEGTGALKVVNPTDRPTTPTMPQVRSSFTVPKLTAGTEYIVSYYIRSDAPGSVRCSLTGNTEVQPDQETGPDWTYITWTVTATGVETSFNFDLGKMAGTYYIDNVTVADKNAPSGELTDEAKAGIINQALTKWISSMCTHYKDQVKAWDVINEPLKEDGTVHDGTEEITASDQFYWEKYLGKDYAVTAFKLARQYGNGASDKLFINDYNLERNLAKCQGLIDYVKYIESQGATVDGIGTQMHIDINADTTKIDQMFQLLATSGKLIKVSELDVKVNTKTPGDAEFEAQANMYRYVASSFIKNVPAAQRYGITVWGISDIEEEHVNWIPDDAPNLWNADRVRKLAYKGFADGLAGKDIGAGFPGIVYEKK